jgi:hypothetical protein
MYDIKWELQVRGAWGLGLMPLAAPHPRSESQRETLRSWGCAPNSAVPSSSLQARFCHPTNQVASLLSLARTLFLVLLLAAGAAALSLDSRRLVLQPVERMVDRVREMAEDPLRQVRRAVARTRAPGV